MKKTLRREILVVDGYNLIHAWGDLKQQSNTDLDGARTSLNNIISEYINYRGIEGYIVYDAYNVKGAKTKELRQGRLHIIFTKETQTADAYIEKLIATFPYKRHAIIRVASDDMAEQNMVLGSGATRISTRELAMEIRQAEERLQHTIRETRKNRNTLDELLDPDVVAQLKRMADQQNKQ